jgi:hypothetical protein
MSYLDGIEKEETNNEGPEINICFLKQPAGTENLQ